MIIRINNYDEGIHFITLKKKVYELDLDKPFAGNVEVNCKMDRSLSQIVLDCNLSVDAVLTCDRCTEEFERTLLNKFQLTYIFSRNIDDVDDDNVHYIHPETDRIDISKDVREFCILSVPMKILCSNSCKGLCPHCGTNLNVEQCSCEDSLINPIWEPLLKLKNKLN